MVEVLAILPMRGGSKSIPYKSITPVLGRPLCHYTIVEAKKCKLINRFIVYTGDPKIIEVAKQYGLEVPVLEKEEKQNDILLFKDCLQGLLDKENYKPDIIVQLRATVPLRKAEEVDKAIQMLIDNPEADSVRGVCEPDLTPFKMYFLNEDKKYLKPFLTKNEFPEILANIKEPHATSRHAFPPVFKHSGQIDVYRWSNIMEKDSMTANTIMPFFVDKAFETDIDHIEDIPYVEFLLKKFGRDKD